ncbi:MAG: tyrosine-type recombinase/integrase [Faecalibacterium prausnitzii]
MGGKRRGLSPKQQKRTLSGTTLHEVHQLLHNSFLLAVEPVLIRKKFLKWQDAHPEFPRIVFHGLRHSSATYQLMISGGDIKAVQGTTGHASADMLVNTYAHIQQSSCVELGKKFESGFYAKPDTSSPQAVSAAGEPTISMTALLELLKDADPEMKAKLRLALLT